MSDLTEKIIRDLQARDKEYHEWYNLPGFGVRVRRSGHKTFVLYYRPQNRQRTRKLTIGQADAIPLKEAKRLAREYLGEIAAGKDPADRKLAYREGSLRNAYDAFKRQHLPTLSKEHARHRERIFERNFLPKLGDKVLSEVTRGDIKEIIDRIAKTHRIAATNAHRGISSFLSWCQDHGLLEHHVLRGSKLPTAYRPRERALTEDELVAVWRAAEKMPRPWRTYFRMLIATGQRRMEVAGMEWAEIDLANRIWTLPVHRTKNRQQHVVPISPLMVSLLSEAPSTTGFVFPSPFDSNRHLHSFGRATDEFRRLSGVSGWRLHDLRRTAASLMGKIGVLPHVIEAVLNHKSGIVSGIAAVYNKYTYEQEKAEALAHYAQHIETLLRKDQTAPSNESISTPLSTDRGLIQFPSAIRS